MTNSLNYWYNKTCKDRAGQGSAGKGRAEQGRAEREREEGQGDSRLQHP